MSRALGTRNKKKKQILGKRINKSTKRKIELRPKDRSYIASSKHSRLGYIVGQP